MQNREEIDISGYSYDEFVSFIFDRAIRAQEGKYHPWYFDVEVAFNANRLCEFYIRLFRSPDFLLGKYSKAQLEEGLWAIHGSALDCSVQHLIWNTDLPLTSRRECVQSMSDLFNRLFATEPLETSVFGVVGFAVLRMGMRKPRSHARRRRPGNARCNVRNSIRPPAKQFRNLPGRCTPWPRTFASPRHSRTHRKLHTPKSILNSAT